MALPPHAEELAIKKLKTLPDKDFAPPPKAEPAGAPPAPPLEAAVSTVGALPPPSPERTSSDQRRVSYETLERLQQWNTAEFCDPPPGFGAPPRAASFNPRMRHAGAGAPRSGLGGARGEAAAGDGQRSDTEAALDDGSGSPPETRDHRSQSVLGAGQIVSTQL